jgi:Ankyrin repeats (3 copies)/Leucine rich repeat
VRRSYMTLQYNH